MKLISVLKKKEEKINLVSLKKEVNLSKIGSKNKNLDIKQNISNIKKLEKEYFIDNVIGDGNCLFYSLSNLIFGKINFYKIIRQTNCDYMKEKSELDDFIQNKGEYISEMRK